MTASVGCSTAASATCSRKRFSGPCTRQHAQSVPLKWLLREPIPGMRRSNRPSAAASPWPRVATKTVTSPSTRASRVTVLRHDNPAVSMGMARRLRLTTPSSSSVVSCVEIWSARRDLEGFAVPAHQQRQRHPARWRSRPGRRLRLRPRHRGRRAHRRRRASPPPKRTRAAPARRRPAGARPAGSRSNSVDTQPAVDNRPRRRQRCRTAAIKSRHDGRSTNLAGGVLHRTGLRQSRRRTVGSGATRLVCASAGNGRTGAVGRASAAAGCTRG
jgi:hypothetical protein